MCSEKKNLKTWIHNLSTPTSRKCCMLKLLDHYYEKELANDEAKIMFFIHSQKSTSRIMCTAVSKILMMNPSKTPRTSSMVITMLTLQKRLIIQIIIAMTKDQPPIVTGTIPLIVKMRIKTHPHIVVVNVLANTLAQTNIVTPVCHALITNADFAKTAPLNGLIVQCTILPQVHKWLKQLTL